MKFPHKTAQIVLALNSLITLPIAIGQGPACRNHPWVWRAVDEPSVPAPDWTLEPGIPLLDVGPPLDPHLAPWMSPASKEIPL